MFMQLTLILQIEIGNSYRQQIMWSFCDSNTCTCSQSVVLLLCCLDLFTAVLAGNVIVTTKTNILAQLSLYSRKPSNRPSEKWTHSLQWTGSLIVTDLTVFTLERTSESDRQPLYNGQNLCSQLVHCREVPLHKYKQKKLSTPCL